MIVFLDEPGEMMFLIISLKLKMILWRSSFPKQRIQVDIFLK